MRNTRGLTHSRELKVSSRGLETERCICLSPASIGYLNAEYTSREYSFILRFLIFLIQSKKINKKFERSKYLPGFYHPRHLRSDGCSMLVIYGYKLYFRNRKEYDTI